jgi:hypothetical protein
MLLQSDKQMQKSGFFKRIRARALMKNHLVQASNITTTHSA